MLGKSEFKDLTQRGTIVMFTVATPLQNNCALESHLSATPQFQDPSQAPPIFRASKVADIRVSVQARMGV